jgi:uncharacterized protein YjiK
MPSCDASNIPCRVAELERLLAELQHPPAVLAFGGQPRWNTSTQRGTIPLPPDKVEDSWDSEIAGPATDLSTIVDERQWAGHTPHPLVMSRGVRVSFAAKGTGTVSIQIYVDNVQFFSTTQELAEETTLIPYSAIVPALTRIAEGARIEVLLSGPDAYAGWEGCLVSFLHYKPLIVATALPAPGRLPDLGLWVRETSVDPMLSISGIDELTSSWGSGLCFWPARGTFVMVDNAGNIGEVNVAGVLIRRTTLSGFGDVEDVCCVDSAAGTFAICSEDQKIHVITLPVTDAWSGLVQGGAGWVRTVTTAIAGQSNLGFESITWDAANSRFIVVNQDVNPSGNHAFWSVGSISPYTETLLFRIEHIMLTDYVNGVTLTPEGTYLVIGRDNPEETSALTELSADGRLIQQTTLPMLRYGEGVAISEDGTRIAVCGEVASGEGAQFFTFTRPA